MPFESVLEKGMGADVWLFRYNAPNDITASQLLSEKQGYGRFAAFKTGELYGCNTATTPFYEETPFHPDLLLRDFMAILYPQLGLGEPRYFKKLKR